MARSKYDFTLNCEVEQAKQVVQKYMDANGFKPITKKGETYYKAGDAMVGYKYFNYTIEGNTLTVYAWLKNAFGDMDIEGKGMMSINVLVMSYRNSIQTLFQEIEKLNKGETVMEEKTEEKKITGYDTQTGAPIYEEKKEESNTFQDETMKRQETLCEIGFWLSIVGLILSFIGVTYGVIIYILNYYFASQGLKTRKKGKAIATVVLSSVSIVVIILEILLIALFS